MGLEEKEFKRRTIIAAAGMLKALGHSGLDKFLLELDLPDERIGQGSGLEARTNSLAEFALKNPEFVTAEETRIGTEIVGRATELWKQGTMNNLGPKDRVDFAGAVEREGLPLRENGRRGLSEAIDAWREKEATAMGSESGSTIMATPPLWALNKQSNRARKVFIVHGHAGAEDKVARLVERLGFEAIILNEQADGGKTIVEKLEANSDVGFAVVLLTPDDEGAEKGKPLQGRARQNVILEWGYFAGKLGRKFVCALKVGEVDIPSDFLGLLWKPLDAAGAWRSSVAKELEGAGFIIDWKKVHA